jgi:predicted TIM-barrel fold metal-dependent hydrolase
MDALACAAGRLSAAIGAAAWLHDGSAPPNPGGLEVGLHALRLILAGVFDHLPTLQIIIEHMGEMLPLMRARGFFTNPPLWLALQVMGADRILFAVDYPFSANEQGRDFLDHAALSPADKEKISHLNAERLLGLASV